jgi:hypothetical protein
VWFFFVLSDIQLLRNSYLQKVEKSFGLGKKAARITENLNRSHAYDYLSFIAALLGALCQKEAVSGGDL